MDAEKKSEQSTNQQTLDISRVLGDPLVNGGTVWAHSAAEAVVKRVRKSAAKAAPGKAVAKACEEGQKVSGTLEKPKEGRQEIQPKEEDREKEVEEEG